MTPTLKPGDRDERGRLFLTYLVRGWSKSGRLWHTAPFADRAKAWTYARTLKDAKVTRVYRRESKLRWALRELVDRLQYDQGRMWPGTLEAFKRAVKALEEKP